MSAIKKLNDAHQDMVQHYNGFTSCLIYSTAHEKFRDAITRNWGALNAWSAKSLLILVADEAVETNTRTRPERRTHDPPNGIIKMMTQIPGYLPGITDVANYELSKHFGIRQADMPCIIFFNSTEQPETLVYSFKADDIVDSMHRIFDDCYEAWIDPIGSEANEMSAYRRNMMLRLEPLLNKRKFLRLVSKIASNPAFGSLLSKVWGT